MVRNWCSRCGRITDHVGAGEKAALEFMARAPGEAFRLHLPGTAKDLGEFVQAGGDVLGWLREEFDLLGLAWPPLRRGGPRP